MDTDPDELSNLWNASEARGPRDRLLLRLIDWLVASEVAYLGSRGGTATVPPEQYVANTIDRSRPRT